MPSDILQLARARDRAVSIDHIVRTGEAPLSFYPADRSTIDLSQKDASTIRALDAAEASARERLEKDPAMKALLALPGWSREQRESFEERQAQAVAVAFDEQPLFHDYRTEARGTQVASARDLTHLGPADPFDCDRMSILKGIMTHRIEHRLLGSGGDGGLKAPGSYYVAPGALELSYDGLPPGEHAALISEKTGNMIDATRDRNTYLRAIGKYEFGDYVSGRPFIAAVEWQKDGQTQVGEYRMGSVATGLGQILSRKAAFDAGDVESLEKNSTGIVLTPRAFDEAVAGEHQWLAATGTLRDVAPTPASSSAAPQGPSATPLRVQPDSHAR